MSDTVRPIKTVGWVTAYVARWPFRHIRGSNWLRDYFANVLGNVGETSISQIYGLEFRDHISPPKIRDLLLVSIMQGLILLALVSLSVWMWNVTNDYVLPALVLFSVFHVVPSDQDFLTSGSMANHVPSWLSPITSALSFVVSLPAMIVALPAALLWGVFGTIKFELSKSETG